MPVRTLFMTRIRVTAIAIVMALAAAGCGILSVDEPGDNARITISGSSPVPLRLVLSNNFIQVLNAQSNEITVSLLGSDTVVLNDLPFTDDYGLNGNLRFFLRLINPDSAPASLRIQVRIDGVEPYDVETLLSASQHEYTYTAF